MAYQKHRQGRDNHIHYFPLPSQPTSILRASASAIPSPGDPSTLTSTWSMDVNAMAYCKMSVLAIDGARPPEGLVAVPSLTKDEEVRPPYSPFWPIPWSRDVFDLIYVLPRRLTSSTSPRKRESTAQLASRSCQSAQRQVSAFQLRSHLSAWF